MRRKDFVRMTGTTDEQLKQLATRGHMPKSARTSAGWKDYSIDDVLAFEVAGALVRQGASRPNARDWVDQYFGLALEHAELGGVGDGPIFIGAARVARLRNAEVELVGFEPVVGTASSMAAYLEHYAAAISGEAHVAGMLVTNLNLCVLAIEQRAVAEGLTDHRIDELKAWLP